MITKELFIKFIQKFIDFNLRIEEIANSISGDSDLFWACDWFESVGYMYDYFIESHFSEEAADLINERMFTPDSYEYISPLDIWEELKDKGYV